MRKALAVMVLVAMVAPLCSAAEYFGVTADGSFNLYRSSGSEAYANAGQAGTPRMSKSNQHMAFMSWVGALGDNSGQDLATYIAAQGGVGNVSVRLHFRTNGAGDTGSKILIESLNCGNQGPLGEGSALTGAAPATPDPLFAGMSSGIAFKGCTVPVGGFGNMGYGIYTNQNPATPGGGEAWIAPAGRAANSGGTPFQFSAGQPIRYDISNTSPGVGLFDGYFQDTTAGRNYWALEDLLGLRQNNGMAGGGPAQVYGAGQFLVGGQTAPTQFNPKAAAFASGDPRNNTAVADWKGIILDTAFVQNALLSTENKGIVFTSRIATFGVDDWSNFAFYCQDQAGGAYEAYLEVIPEPATLVLLALGGLAALRRRVA